MNSYKQMVKFIKGWRVTLVLSNLKYISRLKYNNEFYKKYGIKRKVWQSLSYNSIKHHDSDIPWMDKEIDADVVLSHPHYRSLPVEVKEKITRWKEDGYLVLPSFFSEALIDAIENSITQNIKKEEEQTYYNNRLINLFKTNKNVAAAFKDPKLLAVLSFILGKEIYPYQTINFYKSSSQMAHSDSFHLTTEPLGYLIAVSVALEDVKPGSGEFSYYPGSHKLPYLTNKDVAHNNSAWKLDARLNEKYEQRIRQEIEQNNLEEQIFSGKKGDIIIWHANLLHGSRQRENPELTRKSLVMHYFAKGVLCYHESSEKPAVLHEEGY